jgi:hypothetical protein
MWSFCVKATLRLSWLMGCIVGIPLGLSIRLLSFISPKLAERLMDWLWRMAL